ncbi:M48 family metalloprotease [Streptomyces sp. NPDC048269]|uniref:M48 family metalloprotease n=1 Tax=Streptomyces sp. NPDC048269 TaxID=3155753 RepID=UPI0034355B4A
MFLRALLFWLTLTVAAGAIAFPTTPEEYTRAVTVSGACVLHVAQSEAKRLAPTAATPELLNSEMAKAIRERCPEHPVDHPEWRAGLAVGVLAVGGFLLYWLLPYLTILRYGLERVRSGEAGTNADGTPRPCLDAEVRKLAADAGVTVHAVLLNVVDTSSNATAFGHCGRRYVELASGMEALIAPGAKSGKESAGAPEQAADRAVFDSVVRHELGHIRNRDLVVTAAVTALWWSFLTVVVAAFALSLTGYVGTGAGLRQECLQLVLLTCVVYAARNSYLHARELHADSFAADCPADSGAGEEDDEGPRRSLDMWFRRLGANRPENAGETSAWPFGTHPTLARRRAALVHPALADEVSGWEVVLIGGILAFAVNLLLGHSFDFLMFGLRAGLVDPSEVQTLRPVYTWPALPLLAVAGLVIGPGVRYSVLAWGGPDALGLRLGARLARLAGCFWAGLCLGCLIRPGPLTDSGRPGAPPDMLWQSLTDSAALGLASASAVTLGLCALLALGCESVALRRGTAAFLTGTYGALVTIAWFPTALPAPAAPYLRLLVLGPAGAGAVCLWLRRRGARTGPPPRPVRPGHGPGAVTRASSPMRGMQRLLCHLTTLGTTAGAVFAAYWLLTFSVPSPPFVVVESLGLILYVFGMAGAALAPHDIVFRQRVTAAARCLAVAGVLAAVQVLADDVLPLVVVLVLLASGAGAVICSQTTAAALYDLRHRHGRRTGGLHRRQRAGTADAATLRPSAVVDDPGRSRDLRAGRPPLR